MEDNAIEWAGAEVGSGAMLIVNGYGQNMVANTRSNGSLLNASAIATARGPRAGARGPGPGGRGPGPGAGGPGPGAQGPGPGAQDPGPRGNLEKSRNLVGVGALNCKPMIFGASRKLFTKF